MCVCLCVYECVFVCVIQIHPLSARAHLKLPYTMRSIEITKVEIRDESTTFRALERRLGWVIQKGGKVIILPDKDQRI